MDAPQMKKIQMALRAYLCCLLRSLPFALIVCIIENRIYPPANALPGATFVSAAHATKTATVGAAFTCMGRNKIIESAAFHFGST